MTDLAEPKTEADLPIKRKRKFRLDWIKENSAIVGVLITLISVTISALAVLVSYKSFKNTSKALSFTQAQIKESQRQFEINNSPLLQIIADFNDVSLINDWPTQLKYKYKNLGKYPIKILSEEAAFKIDSGIEFDSYRKFGSIYFKDIYVTNETEVVTRNIFSKSNDGEISDSITDILQNGKTIYFYGLVDYENLLNNEIHRYMFIGQIWQNTFRLVHNENFKSIDNYGLVKKTFQYADDSITVIFENHRKHNQQMLRSR